MVTSKLACVTCGSPHLKKEKRGGNLLICESCGTRNVLSEARQTVERPVDDVNETEHPQADTVQTGKTSTGKSCLSAIFTLAYLIALGGAAFSANPTLYVSWSVGVFIVVHTSLVTNDNGNDLGMVLYILSLFAVLGYGFYLCYGLTWSFMTNIFLVFCLNSLLGLGLGIFIAIGLILIGNLLNFLFSAKKTDQAN